MFLGDAELPVRLSASPNLLNDSSKTSNNPRHISLKVCWCKHVSKFSPPFSPSPQLHVTAHCQLIHHQHMTDTDAPIPV
jgi:hypothetical protein